jgi:hypothetical protein
MEVVQITGIICWFFFRQGNLKLGFIMPIFLNEYIWLSIANVSCGILTGKYWQKIAEERKKKPKSILLADKNAPNEEVWRQVSALYNFVMAYGTYFFHPFEFSFLFSP